MYVERQLQVYRVTEREGVYSVHVIDSSLLLSVFMSHKIYISAFHTVGGIIESQGGEAGPVARDSTVLHHC